MQLVILAGGKGTRLGLKDIPKPMVNIIDKPLLEHQLNLIKTNTDINEIFILSGYKNEVISEYFGNGSDFGLKINHVVEPYPLGTAGALKLIENKINDRFLVFYGDIYLNFDVNSFINYDKENNSTGTIIVHPNDHPFDSDLVKVKNQRVINILKKPHDNNLYYSNLVNAATYIFSKKIFKYIKKDTNCDIAKDLLPVLLKNNEKIYAYNTPEYIKDIGTPTRLEEVIKDIQHKKDELINKKNKRPCIFIDRDGVINEDMGNFPSSDNFKLLKNVVKAVKKINESNYLAIVVTNQPMIAKGFVSVEEVEKTHKKLETLLGKENAFLNAIYYCPHHPEKGFAGEIPELKIKCNCRKPKPGMLKKAGKEFNIDIKASWIIGDSENDIKAGKAFGCKTVSINKNLNADYTAADLDDAVNCILRSEK